MRKLTGIFPALVTPFDEKGRVDTGRLQRLVEKLQAKGVSGFYVGGSTGESYLLTPDERKKVLEAVKEAADPKMDILANIGMLATDQSIDLAKHAEHVGVTAISSVPPFYFPFTMEELCRYYEDLAAATSVPVLIYNIPAMSGVTFSTDILRRLLNNEHVLGLKHTSYDLFQLQMLIEEYPQKTLFVGHDELFLSAWAAGAGAGIGSTFNIMPEKFTGIIEAFDQGKLDEALKIQGQVNRVVESLCKVGVFKGIKEILRAQGMDCGYCRRPFQPLNEEQKKMVLTAAAEQGLL